MVGVQPLQLGVEILRENPFPGGQLQRVRQRVIPLCQQLLPVAPLGHVPGVPKPVLEVIAQPAQQALIRRGMQPTHARKFLLVLDQAQPALAACGVEEQDADIYPFVSDEVGGVTENDVHTDAFRGYSRSFRHGSHPVWEGLPAGAPCRQKQFRNVGSPAR